VPANERQSRLELERKNIDRGPPCGAKLAMGAKSRKAGLQITHPSPFGDDADFAARLREGRSIKGVQKACAAPIAGAGAGRREMNDGTVVERGRVFDEPSLAARNNCIACGERQWHFLQ